jgi:hypothetical protein
MSRHGSREIRIQPPRLVNAGELILLGLRLRRKLVPLARDIRLLGIGLRAH